MSSDKLFHTEHLEQDLKTKAVRGGSFTVAAQGVRFLLQLVSTAVLARLLLPEDYGLIGMTMVVSGFVGIVRDGGLIYATIQKETITHQEVSLLFWINVSIGLVIALLLVCLSPLVAMVFGEPRLTLLLCALSVPFLIGGCTVQHKALLQRQMSFGKIAIIEIISRIAGIVVAISLAMANFGYWALAFMEIVAAASTLILVWLMLRWKPAAPKWSRDVLSTLRFGGNVVLFNVVNYISRNADNALIGWYWGTASLGLYSRAYSLLMMPINQISAPITAVAVPILSRAAKDPQKLKRIFTEATSMVAALVIPIVVCATVFADDLVRIWLGDQWMDAANIFRLLSVPAFLFSASQPITWLFIVLDRTHYLRNVGLVMAPVNVLAFWIGLPYGPEGVALAYTISSCVLFIPVVRYALKGTPIGMMDVFRTWTQPLLSAASGIAAGLAIKSLVQPQLSQLLTAIVSIGVFGLVYVLVMVLAFGWRARVMAWYARKASIRKAQPTATDPVS